MARSFRVSTNTPKLFFDLEALPPGIEMKILPPADRDFLGEALISALVTIPISVATNLFASWLYDRWKDENASKPSKLKVAEEWIIEVTVETIQEAIPHDESTRT